MEEKISCPVRRLVEAFNFEQITGNDKSLDRPIVPVLNWQDFLKTVK